MKPTEICLKFVCAVLSVQVALMPVSFALKIQIKADRRIREHQDNAMERVGLVKAGSVVEIPDEYVVKTNGKPDLEKTLNNWLRKAGELRKKNDAGEYTYDGQEREYFFPVRISQPAPGSTVRPGHQDTQHFIALKNLARKGAAVIVSDDFVLEKQTTSASAPKRKSAPVKHPHVEVDPAMEASTCATGLCSQPTDSSQPVLNFINAISPALAAADRGSKQIFNRTQNDLKHVYEKFENSCGFPLEQFIPIVKARAEEADVPPEILMGLMTQESSGRCHILNSEKDASQSVGLFQVNSESSRVPRCTSGQKEILHGLGSASRLATGPRCLENPLVNLDESIRILKGFKATLTNDASGFDESLLSTEDMWRLSVSSYNGGAKWPLQAKKDLESFNAINGTSLSAYNWEDLRLFYMRSWLDRGQRSAAFGSSNTGRLREYSVSNLAYAENIVGRPLTEATRPGLASAWLATVKD